MPSPLDTLIRQHLRDYLIGQASFEEFYDWFVPEAGSAVGNQPEDAQRLIYEVWHRLTEFDNGHWTEEELKERLRPAVTNYSLFTAPRRWAVAAGSRSVTLPRVLVPAPVGT